MRLTVLGAGDAFGAGGRLQACLLLETAAARVLVDCGATSFSVAAETTPPPFIPAVESTSLDV